MKLRFHIGGEVKHENLVLTNRDAGNVLRTKGCCGWKSQLCNLTLFNLYH